MYLVIKGRMLISPLQSLQSHVCECIHTIFHSLQQVRSSQWGVSARKVMNIHKRPKKIIL